jgi:hypothetical protein
MEQDERILLLSAAAEELLESVQTLKQQADKKLEKLPRVVRDVLSAVPDEVRKGVAENSGEILREVMKPAGSEAQELAKSLKAAAAEAKASAQALRRTGIMQVFFLLGAVVVIGLASSAVMNYLVKGRIQELNQLKAEIQAIDHDLAKTANVRSFTGKDDKEVFWVEIDPGIKPGELDGKTWAQMPRR